MVLVLETLFGDLKVVVDQQKKVDLERALVEAFQNFTNEGIVDYLLQSKSFLFVGKIMMLQKLCFPSSKWV